MALRLDYVARETGSNLFRNITITLASVMTVAVSLALVGASLMLRSGVEDATARWQGGIEFIVFLNPEATPDQVDAVRGDLEEDPQVASHTFVDQQAAFEEFKELFGDSPEMVESVTPEILPPSFRVVPTEKDAEVVSALTDQYQTKPGVKEVVSATDTIRLVQNLSEKLTVGMFLVAVFLLGAAGLLILNTIRMAMYARRREIEVMKLVGATNWFIRVPFMVEGLIQGVLGAALAIGAVAVFRPFFDNLLPPPEEFPIFSNFVPDSADMLVIYLLLAFGGCVVGTVGAGVAVTRFLDV
ncbi:MAG: ABC transporter permease [Acidimicrobiales bacterium]|jgi:cell division transport system permease protein|nr:ABC transporter permease [Acidimicrobiales bacterium]